jgi:hypothetical protein
MVMASSLRGCVFLSAVRAILRVFTSALKGEPDIAEALGSVGFDRIGRE